MGFVSDPSAYDVLLLGGYQLPGEVDFEIMRELAAHTPRGSGDDGAEPKFRGLKPGDFVIRLKLHTDEDEAAWDQLAPRIFDMNRPTNRNQLSVVHPQLLRMGISRCVVIGIGEKKPKNGDPIEATIKCQSCKRRSDSSHKPKPKNDAGATAKGRLGFSSFNVLGGDSGLKLYGPSVGYFIGPPSDGGPDAASLKDRQYSPVQQARLDNGVPKSTVDRCATRSRRPSSSSG